MPENRSLPAQITHALSFDVDTKCTEPIVLRRLMLPQPRLSLHGIPLPSMVSWATPLRSLSSSTLERGLIDLIQVLHLALLSILHNQTSASIFAIQLSPNSQLAPPPPSPLSLVVPIDPSSRPDEQAHSPPTSQSSNRSRPSSQPQFSYPPSGSDGRRATQP